jgi:hypothetical protein
MSMMQALESVRTELGMLPGVASCKIGLEANISPADYPLIRLVPERATPGRPYTVRTIGLLIYLGVPIADSEGMEEVYEALLALETSVMGALRRLEIRYLESILDRDELEQPYKVMAIRCELTDSEKVRSSGAASLAGQYAIRNSGGASLDAEYAIEN